MTWPIGSAACTVYSSSGDTGNF